MTTPTPTTSAPVPALKGKQLLKGILKNQGTDSCLNYEKPKDENDDVIPIVLVSACSAITIQIRSIGNEGNPVCIFHLDGVGNMRILDFSDEDTFFFTTLVGSTYPENQQFSMEIDGETYKFKHGTNSPKYLSVEKKASLVEGGEAKEVLVLRQLETDKDKIKFQEFVLLSPTPTVTPVAVPPQPIPAPAPPPAAKPKGFFCQIIW